MDIVSAIPPACANWRAGALCTYEGLFACSNCRLVLCKSPLSKASWLPEWDRDGRDPVWASGIASQNLHNPFGSNKYLWGNTPAIDIIQLGQNEGYPYAEDIALLFAASGDLRNAVKTVTNLPKNFDHRVEVAINDREFDVVARNAILLLFALTSLDNAHSAHPSSLLETAECLIHIWYSAFLPTSLLSSLQSKIKPLFSDACSHAAEKVHGTILERTWKFSTGSTLRLVLRKDEWPRMERFVDAPEELTFKSARDIRASVALAPDRADYRDRWYYKDATPFMRLSKQRFRDDGLLLPYGHPRTAFDVPNPTLFQARNSWPFDDKANPLTGWPIAEVHHTSWKATHDSYGKLFAYLRDEFATFLDHLATIKINLQLYNVDVRALPQHLNHNKYTRVKVSNIPDVAYVGTRQTLALFSPLLQTPQQNPHATLITAYFNAVMEAVKMSDGGDQMPSMEFLTKYLPQSLELPVLLRQGASFYKMWDSRTLALNGDEYFRRYMAIQRFQQAATDAKVVMKKTNTVVKSWPTRLKLQPGQAGDQEEFNLVLASNLTGVERYVEWTRV